MVSTYPENLEIEESREMKKKLTPILPFDDSSFGRNSSSLSTADEAFTFFIEIINNIFTPPNRIFSKENMSKLGRWVKEIIATLQMNVFDLEQFKTDIKLIK